MPCRCHGRARLPSVTRLLPENFMAIRFNQQCVTACAPKKSQSHMGLVEGRGHSKADATVAGRASRGTSLRSREEHHQHVEAARGRHARQSVAGAHWQTGRRASPRKRQGCPTHVGLSDHDRVVADVCALREFADLVAGEPRPCGAEDPVDLLLCGRVATADDVAA